jgi:hypothetical protein
MKEYRVIQENAPPYDVTARSDDESVTYFICIVERLTDTQSQKYAGTLLTC